MYTLKTFLIYLKGAFDKGQRHRVLNIGLITQKEENIPFLLMFIIKRPLFVQTGKNLLKITSSINIRSYPNKILSLLKVLNFEKRSPNVQ